eukprot:scaffold497_cov368-Prasinococcus_capsulatus_cf.AAC.17
MWALGRWSAAAGAHTPPLLSLASGGAARRGAAARCVYGRARRSQRRFRRQAFHGSQLPTHGRPKGGENALEASRQEEDTGRAPAGARMEIQRTNSGDWQLTTYTGNRAPPSELFTPPGAHPFPQPTALKTSFLQTWYSH